MDSTKSQQNRETSDNRVQVVDFEIRGLITHVEKENQQPFLVWDVSKTGIGIWTFQELNVGDKVILTVGQPYLLIIQCEVNWCEQVKTDRGYRCGLRVDEEDRKFASLYTAFLKAKKKQYDFEGQVVS